MDWFQNKGSIPSFISLPLCLFLHVTFYALKMQGLWLALALIPKCQTDIVCIEKFTLILCHLCLSKEIYICIVYEIQGSRLLDFQVYSLHTILLKSKRRLKSD